MKETLQKQITDLLQLLIDRETFCSLVIGVEHDGDDEDKTQEVLINAIKHNKDTVEKLIQLQEYITNYIDKQ